MMKQRSAPAIEEIDPSLVELSVNVLIPRRFRAVFEDDWQTTIEIEIVDRRPRVRSLTMSTTTDDLGSHDLRPPLRGKLVPAAVRAACRTLIAGPGPTGQRMRHVPRDELPKTGVIGPISGVAKLRRSADDYDRATKESLRRRRGRPRHQTDPDELAEIAAVYSERRSIADVAGRFPVSRSTAYRRVDEAVAAGLLDST